MKRKQKEILFLLLVLLLVLLIVICLYITKAYRIIDYFDNDKSGLNRFDGIVYINLENREDRKKLIREELDKMGIEDNRIRKVSGIFMPKNGHKGNVQSFIIALTLAKLNNWNNVVIFEDDAVMTTDKTKFKEDLDLIFNHLMKKDPEWNVIMLGQANGKKSDTNIHDSIKKIQGATTKTAIIINSNFYDILLNNFKESNSKMSSEKKSNEKYEKYASDQYWKPLQKKYKFYCFKDDLIKQRPVWSSTMRYSYNAKATPDSYN